jgi:hypothetical protein
MPWEASNRPGRVVPRPSQQNALLSVLAPTPGRSKGPFSASAALLLPRIVLWIHVNDILGTYTIKLDDSFFASPGEVIGLGLDDYDAAGVNALVFSLSSSSPVPKLRVPDITVRRSTAGCQWAGIL